MSDNGGSATDEKRRWNPSRPPPGTPRADLDFFAALDAVDLGAARIGITLEGKAYSFGVRPRVIEHLGLSASDVGKTYRFSTWPRTDDEGRITEELYIHWMQPARKPMPAFPFEIVAVLQQASREDGLLRLHIPLREGSSLAAPFTLTVLIPADKAGRLAEHEGQKVKAVGVLRKGKRLVASKAYPLEPPPKTPASEDEPLESAR